ncbi:ABC transporter ATP-binding protein [Nesterenkonia sp. MY13]|uniref:ABC transporter ATP-binding protein n=1 Tax=Nesterenkonia sedimenti TaxID=1463632 RepID=A0A7X8TKR9_9MICC|nr:ABC transporter ATP-binding protein [Nesterenkonia sedimenti]NLS10366.1 ABC transporter ATP-binding protein [Nesterenkonia sedimenti]
MSNLLEVADLRTSFATEDGVVTAVDGVSFSVERGEVLGIVGESGCGKSVTAESIMRLLDEDSTTYEGEVLFDGGTDLLNLPDDEMRRFRGGRLGMIFQDPMSSLNPVYTIGNQLIEALRTHTDLDKKAAYSRAVEMLTLTRIPDPELRMKQYPHQLSGGQRQRVVIAMALCCEPDLIIADEPTTALDVTTQAKILELMADLRHKSDAGTLFITHDLGVVAEICDRVIVMYLGQVIEDTDVHTLFNTPAHPYTRGLLASTPSVETDNSQDLPIIPGAVPTLKQVPYGCRFAARCPFAIEACREAPVELREYAGEDAVEGVGHKVRCIRAEEIPGLIAEQERRGGESADGFATDIAEAEEAPTEAAEHAEAEMKAAEEDQK